MAKHDPTLDLIFSALGDPTRRSVLAALAQGPQSVSDLAKAYDMALPSFVGHIAKLEKAGLITTEKNGRVRTCALSDTAFGPAEDWLADQRRTWETRLDRLETYLDTLTKGNSDV